MTKLFGAIFAGLLLLSTAAQAQSSGGGSSGRMWGAANNVNGTATDSSTLHSQDGISAGEVNAAKAGLLYGAGNITITSVGAQNIVSTTVIGTGNSVNVNSTQTSSNTGNVTNNGTIAPQKP